MFLPLAERMVEKMVKEDKIEAEAEVRLFSQFCFNFNISSNKRFQLMIQFIGPRNLSPLLKG